MAKCGRNSETTRRIATLHDQGKWFAPALPGQHDRPARSPDACDIEPARRCAANPPAGPGRRGLGQRILSAVALASQDQDRNVGVSRDQLQPPGCHHRHAADFADHRRRRTIAHRVLDDRQQRRIIAWLGMDDIRGRESGLGQAGCVQVAPAADPQYRPAAPNRCARRDTGKEQRSGSIVGPGTGMWRRLMQRAAAQPAPTQPGIQFGQLERHHPVVGRRHRHGFQVGERCWKRHMWNGHGGALYLFPLCSIRLSNRSSGLIVPSWGDGWVCHRASDTNETTTKRQQTMIIRFRFVVE